MLQTTLKKKFILLAVIAAVVLIFWSSTLLEKEYWQLISFFEGHVTARPILSVALFLLINVLSVMFFFFSSILVVPIAVSVWGGLTTTALLLASWLLGAVFSYTIGRYAGYPILKYFVSSKKLDYYRDLFSKNSSLLLVFLLRLTLPSEIPGYALGIIRFNFQKYLWITILAEIPYAFVTVYAIQAILNKDSIVLGVIIFVWILIATLLARLLYKRFSVSKI